MPLIKSKSKKALEKNIQTEMHHGKPQKQAIAIAYDVKRRAQRKKMAEGGAISASNESRPMPDARHNDAAMVSRNSAKHAPMMGDSMKQDNISMQAKKGMRTTPIKHPRMVPSTGFTAKLRSQEDDLQNLPSQMRNEEGANRQGPEVPDNEKQHNNHRDAYAEGGEISAMDEKRAMPDDEYNDSNEISRNDHMHAQDINHQEHPMDDMDQFNQQPEEEAEMEDHASLAAAVMARRKKMAEGGEIHSHDSIYSDDSDQADLSRNADEDANEEDQLSFNALRKENYSESEGLEQLDQPMDSNEHGHESDDDHDQDVVSAIRRKMRVKSAISR